MRNTNAMFQSLKNGSVIVPAGLNGAIDVISATSAIGTYVTPIASRKTRVRPSERAEAPLVSLWRTGPAVVSKASGGNSGAAPAAGTTAATDTTGTLRVASV